MKKRETEATPVEESLEKIAVQVGRLVGVLEEIIEEAKRQETERTKEPGYPEFIQEDELRR